MMREADHVSSEDDIEAINQYHENFFKNLKYWLLSLEILDKNFKINVLAHACMHVPAYQHASTHAYKQRTSTNILHYLIDLDNL